MCTRLTFAPPFRLLVEQNFKLAMDVADYAYVITSGHIVYEGTPNELQSQTEILDRHLGI
jgi:branched-chain amino acid transport system ATP-binding protein